MQGRHLIASASILTNIVDFSMVLRRLGPQLWLSFIVVCFGLVTLGTTWCRTHTDYYAARVMLGMTEAGLFQGGYYTISCWYVKEELQTRCAYWYSAAILSGAFVGMPILIRAYLECS